MSHVTDAAPARQPRFRIRKDHALYGTDPPDQ
jgi:hypothetical protein